MALGVIMLSAISYQTLSTGARPFHVIKRFFGREIAWVWACGALLVCIIWHFPQYALAAGMVEDIAQAVTGRQATQTGQTILLISVAVVVLVISTLVTWNYGRGRNTTTPF